MPDKEYLTVKEVMDILSIARPTVYKYIKEGKLTVYQNGVGNRNFFKREEVEELNKIRPVGSIEQEAEVAAYRPEGEELAALLKAIEESDQGLGMSTEQLRTELAAYKTRLRAERANRAIA